MIKLYQFSPIWGLLNPSPPCMKVEVFLRLANLPYEVVTWSDPSKAPRGKLPFIEHEGRKVADSALILTYLTDAFSVTLDDHLSDEQRAVGHAVSKMLDDHLYWCGVYNRWIDPRVWPEIRKTFFGSLPPLLRDLVAAMMQRRIAKALHLQGLGRHSPAEIYALAEAGVLSLDSLLGDKPFLFGDRPSSVDATLYAYIANALLVPFDTELQQVKTKTPRLLAYCERMAERVEG